MPTQNSSKGMSDTAREKTSLADWFLVVDFISRLVSGSGICTSHEDKTKLIDDFYGSLLGVKDIVALY
jgi:hypothetical protein